MPLHIIPSLHKATHQVGRLLARTDFGGPVSQAEAHVLAQLTFGPASVAELHQSFGHKRSTLSSVLNRLEDRALIERQIHPDDRRSFMIELTPAGRKLARGVRRALEKLERRIAKRLGTSDPEQLVALLETIAAAADEG